MENKQLSLRMDQSHGYINSLFHIAVQIESDNFLEFLKENEDCGEAIYQYWLEKISKSGKDDEEFKNALINLDGYDTDELKHELFQRNILGFVAEIKVPHCSLFSFTNGRPTSWQTTRGYCRVEYCYAETYVELLNTVEKVSQNVFNEYIAEFKRTQELKKQEASNDN